MVRRNYIRSVRIESYPKIVLVIHVRSKLTICTGQININITGKILFACNLILLMYGKSWRIYYINTNLLFVTFVTKSNKNIYIISENEWMFHTHENINFPKGCKLLLNNCWHYIKALCCCVGQFFTVKFNWNLILKWWCITCRWKYNSIKNIDFIKI